MFLIIKCRKCAKRILEPDNACPRCGEAIFGISSTTGRTENMVDAGGGHEYLLAFSCKRRHFCPSCHQKKVVEFGEFLSHISIGNR